jgi:Spy/CpxP family protein refolding chaperone
MSKYFITIEAKNAAVIASALVSLAAALGAEAQGSTSPHVDTTPAPTPTIPGKPNKPGKPAPAEPVQEELDLNTEEANDSPADDGLGDLGDAGPTEEEKAKEAMIIALRNLVKAKGKDAVKSILAKLNVKSIDEIPADKHAAVTAVAAKLAAK